jgi:hypothetical protein
VTAKAIPFESQNLLLLKCPNATQVVPRLGQHIHSPGIEIFADDVLGDLFLPRILLGHLYFSILPALSALQERRTGW